MALLSWFRDPFYEMERPLRLFDQNFGMGFGDEDLFPWWTPARRAPVCYWLRSRQIPEQQLNEQQLRRSGISEMNVTKDNFTVNLNVSHFKPEELSVKTVDNCVVVEAKHEERPDEHGYVYRHFTRRYVLPPGVKAQDVASKLSPDGVLTISAPRALPDPAASSERVIPIQQAAAPAVAAPSQPQQPQQASQQ